MMLVRNAQFCVRIFFWFELVSCCCNVAFWPVLASAALGDNRDNCNGSCCKSQSRSFLVAFIKGDGSWLLLCTFAKVDDSWFFVFFVNTRMAMLELTQLSLTTYSSRSFSLLNLEQNTSYSFLMSCSDRQDHLWTSENISFDTGVVVTINLWGWENITLIQAPTQKK